MTQKPESEPLRCWVRLGGHEVELKPGQAVVGRHDSCHIVLDDPLASRRHAVLNFDGAVLSIEDLGSVNGVLVNDHPIGRSEKLNDGDQIRLGNQKIVVHLGPSFHDIRSHKRIGAETLSGVVMAQPSGDDESTVVREGEALETLALVAEKVLAMGRGAEAERILQKALFSLSNHAQAGVATDPATLQLAAGFAVRLAEATDKGDWIDYVFRLYLAADRVLPGAVVDRLYTAVRSVRVVNLELVRSYLATLQQRQAELGPADRFVLRRIEGLERLVGSR